MSKKNVKEMLEATGDLRYDLILEGGTNHAWITEVSSIEEDSNFESFISRILSNNYSYDNYTVKYQSRDNNYEVKYADYFMFNGSNVNMNYDRYDCDYVPENIKRKADVIKFDFNNYSLQLDYKNNKRV